MNMEAVREAVYDVVSLFFCGAAVIWAEQVNTKPKPPYVTLKTSGISRTTFPVVDDDGRRYYPCSTTLEINLYTKGKPVTGGKNVTGNFMNTAASDLNDFFNFVESDAVTDMLVEKRVSVLLMPPIRDLTGLQNDSMYRYRAMAEAAVSFAQEADGRYGTGGMPDLPNSSGGGTAEMAGAETEAIEELEITGET